MLSQKDADKTFIHFIDFRASTGGAVTLDFLKEEKRSFKVSVEPKDLDFILKYLNDRDSKEARLDTQDLRLYIPPTKGGSEEYLMDRRGRVRRQGGEQYIISPLSYLFLCDYLDFLKVRNGIREGSPLYGKKP